MGPVNYPPATGTSSSKDGSSLTFDSNALKKRTEAVKNGLGTNMWTLPSAQQSTGAMLVLPMDIGKYEDVIYRWESITLNHIDYPNKTWSSNKAKDMEIPNEDVYIIIETDGCMEGWGSVCKWKKRRVLRKHPEKEEGKGDNG